MNTSAMALPRYQDLVDAMAAEIRTGCLTPGTRLPTHRQLAEREKISLVTATRVYAELAAMGLVSGETGRGTFVRETALPQGLGIDQQAVAEGVVDLNFNYPALPGQAEMLRTALRELSLLGDLEALLRYQPHGGRQHEREVIARYLGKQGLGVKAEQILIVSGAQHGLATTTTALLQPGDLVATDALTYSGFKALAEVQRLALCAVPAAGAGMDPEALDALCKQRRVRALYLMPTLHNPLGWVTSDAHRRALVAVARRHDLLIIEDAAYAFLAEDAPPPLAALAPERTIHVSGFSKNVATGLRVGYIAAPPAWVPGLERAIRISTWNTPCVMTALVCNWLEDGTVMRLEAEKRRDAQLRQAIATKIFAGMSLVRHLSSYFVWLPLQEDVRADSIANALMQERISVSTAEPFTASTAVPHAIRIALGSVEPATLTGALKIVRQVLERFSY